MIPPRVLKTVSYVVQLTDQHLGGDATAGAIDFTLPDAPNGWDAYFDKDDASVNAVNLVAPAGGSINGAASFALPDRYDSVRVVCLGSKVYRVIAKSLASSDAAPIINVTKVATIADGYIYDPGFTPRLVLMFHGDLGNVAGFGWAQGASVDKQGAVFRNAGSNDAKIIASVIAGYASGHSTYKVTVFGSTVTITRVLVVEDLKNVVLVAFK